MRLHPVGCSGHHAQQCHAPIHPLPGSSINPFRHLGLTSTDDPRLGAWWLNPTARDTLSSRSDGTLVPVPSLPMHHDEDEGEDRDEDEGENRDEEEGDEEAVRIDNGVNSGPKVPAAATAAAKPRAWAPVCANASHAGAMSRSTAERDARQTECRSAAGRRGAGRGLRQARLAWGQSGGVISCMKCGGVYDPRDKRDRAMHHAGRCSISLSGMGSDRGVGCKPKPLLAPRRGYLLWLGDAEAESVARVGLGERGQDVGGGNGRGSGGHWQVEAGVEAWK